MVRSWTERRSLSSSSSAANPAHLLVVHHCTAVLVDGWVNRGKTPPSPSSVPSSWCTLLWSVFRLWGRSQRHKPYVNSFSRLIGHKVFMSCSRILSAAVILTNANPTPTRLKNSSSQAKDRLTTLNAASILSIVFQSHYISREKVERACPMLAIYMSKATSRRFWGARKGALTSQESSKNWAKNVFKFAAQNTNKEHERI